MSESGDYEPGVWSGHDFDSARKSYRSHAASSFSKAVSRGVSTKDLVPTEISTDSTNPIVIVIDETGSMGEWPATMFSKLPYMEHEAKTEYMGEDTEISWGAIGDANCNEQYPLQVRPFAKGTELAKRLKEIVIEGGGGGTTQESYELAALYYAKNVKMPKAIRPLMIFIGDESPYDLINRDQAKTFARIDLAQQLSTEQIFDELKQRFSVYFIQKPYGNGDFSNGPLTGTSKRVHADWERLVGEDHIALLDDPARVVDVIFGIMAKESGKIPYFKKEIEDRQKTDQVKSVYTALKSIHTTPSKKNSKPRLGHSKTKRPKGDEGDESQPLI